MKYKQPVVANNDPTSELVKSRGVHCWLVRLLICSRTQKTRARDRAFEYVYARAEQQREGGKRSLLRITFMPRGWVIYFYGTRLQLAERGRERASFGRRRRLLPLGACRVRGSV